MINIYSFQGSIEPYLFDSFFHTSFDTIPAGLNIGLINKYYDLAKIGDPLAADHYRKLAKHASDCISCGHCDGRCPFHVAQSDRMEEIKTYFGR